METLSVSQFKMGMAEALNKVDAGQKVVLRRRNRLYTIVPLTPEDEEYVPNETTKAAMAEAKAHIDAIKKGAIEIESVDTSSVEAMLKSCGV